MAQYIKTKDLYILFFYKNTNVPHLLILHVKKTVCLYIFSRLLPSRYIWKNKYKLAFWGKGNIWMSEKVTEISKGKKCIVGRAFLKGLLGNISIIVSSAR